MKTQKIMMFVLIAAFCFSANLSAGELLNGEDQGKSTEVTLANSCFVSDSSGGTAVLNVPESTPSTENLYWLRHQSDGSPQTFVKFVVKFNANSPLKKQVQIFENGGSITTPFGVPFFGGNSIHGPATLVVKTDTQKCVYLFQIVDAP